MAGEMDGSSAVRELTLRLERLERRVAELSDILAISRLAAEYQRRCDGGWEGPSHRDPDALADLFTEDGEYILPELPPCRGRAEIRELFVRLRSHAPWIVHYTANEIIDVSGDEARGEIKGSACFWRDGRRYLTFGTYRGVFARTGQGWRFRRWEFVRAQQPRQSPF